MPRYVVTDLDDPRLEPYRNIRFRDPTNDGRRFIAEGKLVVERLLLSRHSCQTILVEADHHADIVALAESRDQPPDILSADLSTLRRLVGFDFHRGILACGEHPPLQSLTSLPEPNPLDAPLLIVCGINNPENIGGLMRSAAAFGVRHMALTHDVAHPYSRRALRVSMATALLMDFYELCDPVANLKWLCETRGFKTLATALCPDAIAIGDVTDDGRPIAVLVGSEGEGLPKPILDACEQRVVIPMSGGVDSLNANVATAIFLYELTTQTP